MRRVLGSWFVGSVMVAGLMATAPPAGAVAGFGDVLPERFYTDAVQWMVDNEITTGTSANCFSPNDPVTRGQAAAFMWRMEGFPDPGPLHPFGDVVKAWQQDPVSWLFNNDITTGTSPSTFSPDDTVTRGQLAAFLYRYKGSPEVLFDAESRACDPLFDGERLFLFVDATGNPACDDIGVGPPPDLDVVYECSTAIAFPAWVPFFVGHGWAKEPELITSESLTAGTRVELAVDGVPQAIAEVLSEDPESMSWRFGFPDGMSGVHTFVVEWYERGVLVLRSEVEVTFS